MNTNRVILTAILIALSVACAWAGGPEPQLSFSDLRGVNGITNGGTGQTASTAALVALGGMKTDASNSDAATARTNLGVVATSTFTAHTDATTGVHGAAENTRFFTASETLGIANGGTGATTGNAALSALGISNHNQITVYSSGAASFAKDISQNYAGTHGNVGRRDIAFGRSSTAVPYFIATGTITGNGDVAYIVCDVYAVREADVASGAAVFRVSAKAGKTGGTATFETPVVDTVKATEAGLSVPSAAWTTSGDSGSLWITPGDTYVAYYVQTSIVTRGGGAFTW